MRVCVGFAASARLAARPNTAAVMHLLSARAARGRKRGGSLTSALDKLKRFAQKGNTLSLSFPSCAKAIGYALKRVCEDQPFVM